MIFIITFIIINYLVWALLVFQFGNGIVEPARERLAAAMALEVAALLAAAVCAARTRGVSEFRRVGLAICVVLILGCFNSWLVSTLYGSLCVGNYEYGDVGLAMLKLSVAFTVELAVAGAIIWMQARRDPLPVA